MNPGDVGLIPLQEFGRGATKLRPALVLAQLPGAYQNLLLCGISTQLQYLQANWDGLVQPGDTDFQASGVHHASAIRLSYLYAADPTEVAGVIGLIDPSRLQRLRQRLADHLLP